MHATSSRLSFIQYSSLYLVLVLFPTLFKQWVFFCISVWALLPRIRLVVILVWREAIIEKEASENLRIHKSTIPFGVCARVCACVFHVFAGTFFIFHTNIKSFAVYTIVKWTELHFGQQPHIPPIFDLLSRKCLNNFPVLSLLLYYGMTVWCNITFPQSYWKFEVGSFSALSISIADTCDILTFFAKCVTLQKYTRKTFANFYCKCENMFDIRKKRWRRCRFSAVFPFISLI